MRIDGHAHACGEYLTLKNIDQKIKSNQLDYVVLVPGEYNNKKTYHLKDRTLKNPEKDAVLKINKLARIIVTLTQTQRDIPKGNEYVFSMAQQDARIKQFFWITKGQWDGIEKSYERMRFHGVKIHQCWEKLDLESPLFAEICEFAIQKDMPLFAHLYSHADIVKLIKHIKQNKALKVIVAHHFGCEYFLEDDVRLFDNVFFDMSNTYFVSKERVDKTLSRFGSTKLLLGSDTPYGCRALEKAVQRISELDLSENERENILGNNMARLLKL